MEPDEPVVKVCWLLVRLDAQIEECVRHGVSLNRLVDVWLGAGRRLLRPKCPYRLPAPRPGTMMS